MSDGTALTVETLEREMRTVVRMVGSLRARYFCTHKRPLNISDAQVEALLRALNPEVK